MKTSKILLAVVLGSSGALLGASLSTTDARAKSKLMRRVMTSA